MAEQHREEQSGKTLSRTRSLELYEPVIVTDEEHKGKTGEYQHPCAAVVTVASGQSDNEKIFHVLPSLLRAGTPEAPSCPSLVRGERVFVTDGDLKGKIGNYLHPCAVVVTNAGEMFHVMDGFLTPVAAASPSGI